MPVFQLDDHEIAFPPPYLADENGLLAVGGDLSPQRLVEGYKLGIFPWYNPDEPILWWSPDPRFVLYPNEIKISKSMKQILRSDRFQVTFDQDFIGVISGCKEAHRPGQPGTWISDEIIEAYSTLHQKGFIHSVEVWQKNKLVGGLYGGCIGSCFFGESMFSKVSNASKTGFIILVQNLQKHGFELIDCQVHSSHLESLGAKNISREAFLKYIFHSKNKKLEKISWGKSFSGRFYFGN